MSVDRTYANAKKSFQDLGVGERISALELATRIGATIYQEKKKVAAFLSQQARKGRVRKQMGEDGRMYYEKIVPVAEPSPVRVGPPKDRGKDTITVGEIGESIVNYIERMRERIDKLQKERHRLREKVSTFSKQKEEFKRLYHEAEQRLEELSSKQPVAQRTIRLSKYLGD